jgi:hypothetical protein
MPALAQWQVLLGVKAIVSGGGLGTYSTLFLIFNLQSVTGKL